MKNDPIINSNMILPSITGFRSNQRERDITANVQRDWSHWTPRDADGAMSRKDGREKEREQIPRVANRASDCQLLALCEGYQPRQPATGCREGCCQLEWTAQDLPPPARNIHPRSASGVGTIAAAAAATATTTVIVVVYYVSSYLSCAAFVTHQAAAASGTNNSANSSAIHAARKRENGKKSIPCLCSLKRNRR